MKLINVKDIVWDRIRNNVPYYVRNCVFDRVLNHVRDRVYNVTPRVHNIMRNIK